MATRRDTHETRRSHRAALRRRDWWSLCLLGLFVLQGIVAQAHTHVHSATAGASVVLFGSTVATKTDDGRTGGAPQIPDSPTCSLCQSLGAGNAPLAIVLLSLSPVPRAGFPPEHAGERVLAVGAVSYSWTSRGPPSSAPLHV
jgi:hypothetical protein